LHPKKFEANHTAASSRKLESLSRFRNWQAVDFSQSASFQKSNDRPRQIDLAPTQRESRRGREFVIVIVKALSTGKEGDELNVRS